MTKIKVGVVGVGNCASSLIQGIHFYKDKSPDSAIGLMHWEIGGCTPGDIEIVAAFDIDERKVGTDVAHAIFAPPNCTTVFCGKVPPSGTTVRMGRILDGVSPHMAHRNPPETFVPSRRRQPEKPEVVRALRERGVEVLLNYLPVGSEQATRFYAECALEAGCALVNNIPVFIASDPAWAARFHGAGLPLIGDDIKAQVGATIIHRTLVNLFKTRGVKLRRTYQLNTGGNTDFLNMLNRERLESKKRSKTEAVQSAAAVRLPDSEIHVGPSDYVPWQKDNKIGFIRLEGRLFGDVPMNLELRLSVEDSPNSAGVAIDAVRCARLALERGLGGVIHPPSSYFCKHPPRQVADDQAHRLLVLFIAGQQQPESEVFDTGGRRRLQAAE